MERFRCECGRGLDDTTAEDVRRLVDYIAMGEIDEALDLLYRLAPDEVPLPSIAKRVAELRRAQPATRAS